MNSRTLTVFIGTIALLVGSGTATAQQRSLQPAGSQAAGSIPAKTTESTPHAGVLPASLRPALYRALTKDAGSAYQFGRDGCARLPGSSLKACFGKHGVNFSGSDTAPVALRVLAFGRGKHLVAVKAVRPEIEGNRVGYKHGTFDEWWRALPIGFEQGFTLTARPAGQGALRLVLAANGKPIRHDDGLAWGRLHYGALVVTDAGGKRIPARLETAGKRILIAVNDAHAAYPLTVDPLVWLEQKVVAGDGAPNDEFGASVAVSGETAVVGALGAAINGNKKQGAAYVFTDSNGVWHQTQKLVANDGLAGDEFGYSVAISGTTIAVGAIYDVYGVNDSGAVYVFSEEDGTWTQVQKLTASDADLNDNLGWSTAISGDTIVSGAPNKHGDQGAAYVFTDTDGTWAQSAELFASDGAPGDNFGVSVAVSGDTALVGSNGFPGDGSYKGAAYVFDKTGGNWNQTAELSPSDSAAGDFFGQAVALDGDTALVGAHFKKLDKGYHQGATYVFTHSGDSWTQTQELKLSDSVAGDDFGLSVAISGSHAVVSAPGRAVSATSSQGAAYIYTNANGSWTQTQEVYPSDGGGNDFGDSVALDGTVALAGAWGANINGNGKQGAAYLYSLSNLALAVSAPVHVRPGGSFVSQAIATNGASAASPAVAVTVAVPAAASFVSANVTPEGSCSETAAVVTCDLGQIPGNAGTATANLTFTATGDVGDTIENTASIAKAFPSVSASAATAIVTNNPPVASDGTLSTKQNTAASGTLMATDPDGDPLKFSIVDQPQHGSVTLDDATTGAYTYTPNKGFSGKDSFTFKANDGEADSNVATVSVTVKSTSSGGGGGANSLLGLGLLLMLAVPLVITRRRRHRSS